MVTLYINGTPVTVLSGTTLLEAAEQAGARIPTLCHAPELSAQTSCMVCVVEERSSGRLIPACSFRVTAPMDILTDSETVHEARRRILELLMSEHAGDCEAPCRRLCPAGLNIPLMLRFIARGEEEKAARLAAADLALPLTLGWVCHHPCEAGCRRKSHDESVAIREMHRYAADQFLGGEKTYAPSAADSDKRAAVVGSGPAGLAAAWVLRSRGVPVHVFERDALPGGMLRHYPEEELPPGILDQELAAYTRAGIVFHCGTLIDAGSLSRLFQEYDAVVLACTIESDAAAGVQRAVEDKYPVRSVRSGKEAAMQALVKLEGAPSPEKPPYDSQLGRVDEAEIQDYMKNRVPQESLSRSRCPESPKEESGRCLHCDCHAPVSCKLRLYATRYGARPRAWRQSARPLVPGLKRDGRLLFDTGKCIKCGLCIEMAKKKGDLPGMAFSGRGFDTIVTVPFDAPLLEALARSSEACVAVCPTGALVFDDQEECSP